MLTRTSRQIFFIVDVSFNVNTDIYISRINRIAQKQLVVHKNRLVLREIPYGQYICVNK